MWLKQGHSLPCVPSMISWCTLTHDKPHAMDVLPPIPHVLCVYGQCMTSLGHNQNTGILPFQAFEHPSRCGTRFGETCKTTKLSSGWYMLYHEEPHAMDMLQAMSHISWVHVQGLTSMWPNQYTRILSIQASKHPRCCGTRFDENCKTTNLSTSSTLQWFHYIPYHFGPKLLGYGTPWWFFPH